MKFLRFSNLRQDDRGAILPLVAFAMVAIMSMMALSIDHTRGVLVHQNAEDLADAIALAAVSGFDGTQSGWRNTKRLALIAFREAHIAEVDPNNFRSVTNFQNAISDSYETDSSNFGGNTLVSDDGRISVRVDRGFYRDVGGGDYQFRNLDDGVDRYMHLPDFYLGNAVRVLVEIQNLTTPFANVAGGLATGAGFEGFNRIRGEAIAVRNQDTDVPVAPFAIPACEFFSDLNPGSRARYTNDEHTGTLFGDAMRNQCQREVIARNPVSIEGDYDSMDADTQKLVDGHLRSNSYARPPLWSYQAGQPASACFPGAFTEDGVHENCKAFPLNAIMGVPVPPASLGGSVGFNAVRLSLIDSHNGTLVSRLNSAFLPINGDTYLNAGASFFSDTLDDYIMHEDNPTFREAFYGPDADGDLNFPRANFPFRRNLIDVSSSPSYTDPFAELRVTWVDENGRQAVLMDTAADLQPVQPIDRRASAGPDHELNFADGQRHFRYTNPMCHSQSGDIPYDDADGARVRLANIMLIASESESYCDYNATIDSTAGSPDLIAALPIAATNPVVVGYMPAYIFDHNIQEFAKQDGWLVGEDRPDVRGDTSGPYDLPRENSRGDALEDTNQIGFDSSFVNDLLNGYTQQANDYASQRNSYVHCQTCLNNGQFDSGVTPIDDCVQARADYEADGNECRDTEEEQPAEPDFPEWYDTCFGDNLSIDLISDELDRVAGLEAWSPIHTPPYTGGGGEGGNDNGTFGPVGGGTPFGETAFGGWVNDTFGTNFN